MGGQSAPGPAKCFEMFPLRGASAALRRKARFSPDFPRARKVESSAASVSGEGCLNRRRAIVALASLGSVAALPLARAQAPAKVPRVAILMYGSPANFQRRADVFTEAMRQLGYVEDRNISYDWRAANGQADLLRLLADQFVRERFDVIVSATTLTSRELHRATKTIPVVMGQVEDPVAEGFVQSLARPGTNMTGICATVLDQVPKQFELLAQATPHLAHVTALLNPADPTYRAYRARVEAAARAAGVQLAVADASTPNEIDRAFTDQGHNAAAGVVVMHDPSFYTERGYITELASRVRRPAIYPQRGYVEAGGLMSYGFNPEAHYARVAAYVDRILKGAKPAELPVEMTNRYELVINREAARGLGLALPPELLKQATKIIK